MEDSRQLDEARVKALTGSERGTGRALYEGMREWTNTAKLWLDLNHLPAFKGVDDGISRRPRVIPFDNRFYRADELASAPAGAKVVDLTLADRLKAELPGILAWAVEGCRRWRERGLDGPEAVSLATRRYRDDNNHLPAFMEEHYLKRAGARVLVSALKADYQGWCALRDEHPLDYQRKVVPFLEQVWKLAKKRVHGGSYAWVGIASKAEIARGEAALAQLLGQPAPPAAR
jgi:putative DNA primase/helicase